MSMFRTLLEQMKTPTYTEVLYLESTGTQWINTEFTATDNTKVEIKLSNVTGDDCPIISASTDWNMGRYIMTSQDNKFIFWYAAKHEFGSIPPVNNIHTISVYRDVITYDDTTPFNDSTNRNVPNLTNLWIFATPGQQRSPNKFKLYYCKIWDNDVLVRDLIPVLDENNVPCLYDKVEKKFYYNAGTGTFVYQTINLISYIQATGSEQIDTGYIPNADTQIDITFMLPSTLNERSIFAAKWDLNGFVLMDYGSGLRWHNNTSTWYNFNYYELNQRPRTLTIYQNTIDVDGSNIITGTYSSITYTNTIKLFAFNSQHQSACRMYEYKISENGTVLHDFVPALDNNVPCLYDKIGKQFYYNIGGGTFLYG